MHRQKGAFTARWPKWSRCIIRADTENTNFEKYNASNACLLELEPLVLDEEEEEEDDDEVPSRSLPRAAISSAVVARSGRSSRSAASPRALILGRLTDTHWKG